MSTVVTQLGPLGVFLLMVPESACVPVPSEVTLLAAGFAVDRGWMAFWAAVVAATVGNLAGSLLAYAVGRVLRGHLPRWGGAGLASCDRLFARHGTRAVFVARLMPLSRTFVSLPAGHARVPLAPFLALTMLGCALWAVAFVLAGTLVGAGWTKLDHAVGLPLLVVGAMTIIVALRKLARLRR